MTPINASVIIIISNEKGKIIMKNKKKIDLAMSEKIKMKTERILVVSIDGEGISYRFSSYFNRLEVKLIANGDSKKVAVQDALDNIRLKIDKAFMALDDELYQGYEITDILIQYISDSLRMEFLGCEEYIKRYC